MRPFEWFVEKLARWCRPVWETVKAGDWNDPSIWRTREAVLHGRLGQEIARIIGRMVKGRNPASFYRTRRIDHPVRVTGRVECEELILKSGPIYFGDSDSLTVTGIG